MRTPSMYVTITGAKQGVFKGEVTKEAQGIDANSIGVFSVDYLIDIPRDAATGMPTGKRQHHPMTLVTRVTASTINMLTALSQNENISKFVLAFYKPDADKQKKFMTWELGQATLVSYNMSSTEETSSSAGTTGTGGGTISGAGPAQTVTEARLARVSFVFQKITVTWIDGGLTYADDWTAMT